ncbi:MAG: hypothetical protein FWC16_12360 [Defluviitaleaceae bacterium]|nr:hypothetical protein [Defluviitaleaceae bacterium]MCL2275713.1 hypothetical protein [Defluviitaleaceae bacterium]
MNLSKSIDFLLENAGAVIQYRLRKEILGGITPAEEEKWLAQIYALPNFKLVESYAKPNGFIGEGIHGFTNWRGVKFHQTPLQDGESAAKLLVYYGIPKAHPLITGLVSAYRNDDVLQEEYRNRPPTEYKGFLHRNLGLRQGGGLNTLLYTLQAMLGYGDDAPLRHFQEISLDAFAAMLQITNIEEITEDTRKKKGNFFYHFITEEKYMPCCYHLATLAYTQSWRTPENIKILARAINHINNDLVNETEGILIKGGSGYLGTLGALVRPILPFSVDTIGHVMHRRLLTEMAMTGAGTQIEILRISAENLREALEKDGILRLNYASEAQKKAQSGSKYNAVGGYGEVFLEPDYRKKTALDCDLTFWAVQFLTMLIGK